MCKLRTVSVLAYIMQILIIENNLAMADPIEILDIANIVEIETIVECGYLGYLGWKVGWIR